MSPIWPERRVSLFELMLRATPAGGKEPHQCQHSEDRLANPSSPEPKFGLFLNSHALGITPAFCWLGTLVFEMRLSLSPTPQTSAAADALAVSLSVSGGSLKAALTAITAETHMAGRPTGLRCSSTCDRKGRDTLFSLGEKRELGILSLSSAA